MELKTLLGDERGVSPVIGVILMVAITVILAAVIGTFVLGLGSNVGTNAPSATFNYDQGTSTVYANNTSITTKSVPTVSVTDQGGQKIQTKNVQVTVNGQTAYDTDGSSGTQGTVTNVFTQNQLSAGASGRIAFYNASSNSASPLGNKLSYDTNGGQKFRGGSKGPVLSTLSKNDKIRIVWSSGSGGSSSIISTHTVS